MNKKQLREKYINDFFKDKFSGMVKHMTELCNIKNFDYIEVKSYPDPLERKNLFIVYFIGYYSGGLLGSEWIEQLFEDDVMFDEKELKENNFKCIKDFVFHLEYEINRKYKRKN